MPLPTPQAGESETDFMARCIPVVEAEGKPHDQAVAVCLRQFRENRGDDVPEVKHLDVPFEIKQITDAGEFEGYASVFDVVDMHNERVARGAFEESLTEWRAKNRLPPMLWQHFMDEPIGYFTEMAEDDEGLRVKGQLLIDDVAKAKEARALMQHRVLGGLSIGFMAIRDSFDQRTEVRTLEQIKLMEVSAVTFPANEAAIIESVRSLSQSHLKAADVHRVIRHLEALIDDEAGGDAPSPKECERALREAGATRRVAKAIMAKGYAGMVSETEREAGKQTEAQERFSKFLDEALETAPRLFVHTEG